jgi:hypothetical protein
MMEMSDRVLATLIKSVSIRKQNLYGALQRSEPDTDKWKSINAQIEENEEAATVLEDERSRRRLELKAS